MNASLRRLASDIVLAEIQKVAQENPPEKYRVRARGVSKGRMLLNAGPWTLN